MRIIAGQFRGRNLLSPESDTTRPITDRVKQSLFDILAPLIPDSVAYDCFAGTGSMGLECLSRGATRVAFFEIDRSALARLRRNIDTLKVQKESIVVPTDIFRYFSGKPAVPPADLIFLDPPYRFLNERADPLRDLSAQLSVQLKPEGTLVFRHDVADQLDLPTLDKYDERTYGGMALELLHPRK